MKEKNIMKYNVIFSTQNEIIPIGEEVEEVMVCTEKKWARMQSIKKIKKIHFPP
jgi:hypothetical protein